MFHKSLSYPTKLDPPDRVSERVKRRGPEGHAHHVGDNEEDGATDPGLGGQPHLEGELPAVVVHAAAVHQAQHVPDVGGVEHLVSGGGADPAIGQGCPHHRQGLSVYLHTAGLKIKVQSLVELSSFGKTILFLHEVAHREVSVSRCPLREKHRIVKPEKFVTLEIKHDPKTPAHSILPPSL